MPAITRKGDADVTHCSTPFRLGASENVFVNNIGVSRQVIKIQFMYYQAYLVHRINKLSQLVLQLYL